MGEMTNKQCQDCGKSMRVGPRSRQRKYCETCVKQRGIELRRKQKDALKKLRHSEDYRRRTCTTCGDEFLRPAGRAGGAVTRCETCRATPVSKRTLPDSRPCETCGTIIELEPNSPRRFCQACRVERNREQDRQAKARARPNAVRTLTCERCGNEFQKNPRGRDPRACPACRKADYESRRPPRKTKKEDVYRWRLARQYGMTIEQREAMADRQGHACALCGLPESPERKLHVDHDHSCCPAPGTSCGKCIRGLICYSCNNALGLIADDLETLRRMVVYIRDGGAPRSPNRSRRR